MRDSKKLWFVKLFAAIAVGFCILFPIYLLIVSSLKPVEHVFDMRLIPREITFEGYTLALNESFGRYFLNSVIVATAVTIVALIFHAMAGYSLARLKFTGKKVVFALILSTMMVPFSVLMIPLFILVKELGWLNTYAGIIIPAIPHAYGIFLFRQFFLTMPNDLQEAASIDGCTKFGIFVKIFLPLSKPITITLAVAFFIANWNNYLWPLLIAQKQEMWVLQVAIANFIGRTDTPWNAVLAAGVITVLPTMVMFFVLQKYLVEGIKMSGIK